MQDRLNQRINTKVTSCDLSTWDFILDLIPDQIKDPEGHEAINCSIQAATDGETSIGINGHYKKITEQEYAQLYSGLNKINKLLSGASVKDRDTILVADGLERVMTVLLKMTGEDAHTLQHQALAVTEKVSGKIARRILDRDPEGKIFNEREIEAERSAQMAIQHHLYNSITDRILACRTMVDTIRDIQSELREHARTTPIIESRR